MSTPVDLRSPNLSATPDGSVLDTAMSAFNSLNDTLFLGMLPAYDTRAQPRLVNAGEISAATGSVVTESSPDFIDRSAIFIRSFGTAYKETFDDFIGGVTDSGQKVTAGAGSLVTKIFPWWFWALLGLGLLTYIVVQVAPLFKAKAAP